MRKGTVFRRCTRCKAKAEAKNKRCSKCGHDSFTWAYVVDVAPVGMPRKVRMRAGFATQRAALEDMHEAQGDAAAGTYVDRSKITLGEYLHAWWQAGNWEPNTTMTYRVAIERHIIPRLGSTALQTITSTHIKALYQELAKTGLVRTRKEKDGSVTRTEGPLARKSVHNVHICLRAALNDAVDDRLLRANPASRIGSPYDSQKHRSEMKVWSEEEARAFLRFAIDRREYCLYRTALSTGMRRGELLGLRRQDLRLNDGRLNVRQQWCYDGDNGRQFKTLKTGSKAWRTIDLDQGTIFLLQRVLKDQEAERGDWGPGYSEHDLVFCRPNGEPYDPASATRSFERLAKACPDVRPIRFHDMRHSHATQLLEEGYSTKYVAERLGDREDTIGRTYAHVTSKSRRRAVETISMLLDEPATGEDAIPPLSRDVQKKAK